MKKIKNIKTKMSLMSILFFSKITQVYAAPGVDEEADKDLIGGYVNPIRNILIWVVPIAAAIGALILGIRHFFKNEQEQEEFDLAGKLIKLGIAASILQSIAIVFKIFGVV